MPYGPKMIDYLSKEIIAQTNNLMTFRARINFAVFVGPFVLLGSLLYSGKQFLGVRNLWIFGITLLLLILSYLTMGWACASIEIHVWRQCNKWRALIAQISCGRKEITPDELQFKHKLRLGYWVVYGAMTLAFVCVLVLISQLELAAGDR